MATAGTINILVRAVTQDFDKKIAGVEKSIKGLTRGFADIAGALNVVQLAVGKAQEAVNMLNDELVRLDKIGDIAARFNVTAEAVQTMQRAIQLSGGEVESLTRVLGKMQNVLGDAGNGNAGAVSAFERLGLSAAELSQQPLSDAFEQVVRSIAKIPNAASRAATATDIFGKASVEMLEIFTRQNVFEDATQDVKDFGVQLDQTRLNSIEKATEALNRMKMAKDAARAETAIASAPTLTFLSRAEANFSKGVAENGLFSTLAFLQRDILAAVLSASPSLPTASTAGPPLPPRMLTPPDISARSGGVVHSMLAEWGQLQDAGLFLNPPSGAANPNLPGFGGNPFTAELRRMIGIEPFSPSASGATGGAGAMEFGSLGAYQAIQASKREDESRRLMRQEVEESKKQTKLLERIEDALVAEEVLEPANLQG